MSLRTSQDLSSVDIQYLSNLSGMPKQSNHFNSFPPLSYHGHLIRERLLFVNLFVHDIPRVSESTVPSKP